MLLNHLYHLIFGKRGYLSFYGTIFCKHPIQMHINYTPIGYIVPAEFGVHFLPLMKNIPKQTKLHLNEIGLTNIEFCKRQI